MDLFDDFKQTGVNIEEQEDGSLNIYPKNEDNIVFGYYSENRELAAGCGVGQGDSINPITNGEVILAKVGGEILFRKELRRPEECGVSNTGRVVVTNGRKLHVFDRDGSEIFFKEFDVPDFRLSDREEKNWNASKIETMRSQWKEIAGRLGNCAISPDGARIVAVADTQPRDPSPPYRHNLFAYDLTSNKELLQREMPCNKTNVWLKINDEVISIVVMNVGAHSEDNPEYIIDLKSGNVVGGKRKQDLDRVKNIYGKKK